mgnify:FL=1
MKYKYNVKNLDCAMCAKKIEEALNKDKNIENASLNYSTLKLSFDTKLEGNVLKYVNDISTSVEPNVVIYEEDNTNDKDNNKIRIITLVVGIIIGILGMYLNIDSKYKNILIIISYIILLYRTFIVAIKMFVKSKTINENFLIVISVVGAYLINQAHEGFMVIVLYEIGKILEDVAINKSRRSIKELMDIKPNYANIKVGNNVKKIDPEEIKVGDILVVKTGEKIAIDGTIIKGSAKINSSALTGESKLKTYSEDMKVMSGMINEDGLIYIKAETIYENSTVNKILDLVENASNNKAKTENFVSRASKIYTPLVVVLSILVTVVGSLVTDLSIDDLIYRSLLFLVISCPCAIAISVPLSYFASIGSASKKGILVKGSNYIDLLKDVNVIAFDKTGTITSGKFDKLELTLVDKRRDKKEIESIVVKGEKLSNHIIAKSIVDSFNVKEDDKEVSNFKELKGKGITFTYNKKNYMIGNDKLNDVISKDVIGVVENDKLIANIDYLDEIKNSSYELFKYLKSNNIKTLMFTGDTIDKANKIKEEIDIDEVYAGLLPEDKYKLLKEEIDKGNIVSFVGDGINDSAVLALSHVGISMGSMGAESSVEASDIVIVNDDISKIKEAIELSKYTSLIVKENLIFAILTKVTFMVLGLVGIASMWEAVFADVGVTVITILNSIRILKK